MEMMSANRRHSASMENTPSTLATEEDVRYCYRLFLQRAPDEEGWATFSNAIRTGVTLGWLVGTFMGSVEFKNRLAEAEQRDVPQIVHLQDFRIYVLPEDLAVGRPIMAQRIYEPLVTAEFRRLVKPGMVVADVGANIGYFSLLCARLAGPEGKVVAVEPGPQHCALLRFSAAANGFENVEIHQLAVAEKEGFYIYHGGSSGLTLTEVFGPESLTRSRLPVRSTTLDEVLKNEERVDVLRMDIEGAEYRALLGSVQTLRKHRPVLVIEFVPADLRNVSGIAGPEFLEHVIRLGYEVTVVDYNGYKVECGRRADKVMGLFDSAEASHLDLVCTPV